MLTLYVSRLSRLLRLRQLWTFLIIEATGPTFSVDSGDGVRHHPEFYSTTRYRWARFNAVSHQATYCHAWMRSQ